MSDLITTNLNSEFKNKNKIVRGAKSKPYNALPSGCSFNINNLSRYGAAFKLGADVDLTEAQIRNPLLNVTNFYIPMNRRIMNQWIRYYDRFQPLVGNSLDLHGEVPIAQYSLTGVNDTAIQQYYEDMCYDEIDLLTILLGMSREYEALGEVFPYAMWDKTVNRFSEVYLLNPDWIELTVARFSTNKDQRVKVELIPDDQLKKLIKSNDPEDIEMLSFVDQDILYAIENDYNMELSNFNVTPIIRRMNPYDDRGTSIVLRCFVEGTEVFMNDGSVKNIEDIKIGDSCWTHKGRTSDVVDVIQKPYSGTMVRIQTPNIDKPVECTADHKFPVYSADRYCVECNKELTFKQWKKGQKTCSRACTGLNNSIFRKRKDKKLNIVRSPKIMPKIIWKRADELKEGDLLIQSRQTEFIQPKNITPDKARLLGYFLAEGSYNWNRRLPDGSKNRLGLGFSFHINETDTWIRDVQEILKREYNIDNSLYPPQKGTLGVGLNTRSSKKRSHVLAAWMYKMAGEHAKDKKIAAEVFSWPLELQKQILIGFCRGDGSVATRPCMSCATISKALGYQLSRIAYNLGLPHKFRVNESIDKNGNPYFVYELHFQGSVNEAFIDECYPTRDKLETNDILLVKKVLNLKEQGLTHLQIVNELNRLNIKSAKGKNKLACNTVGLILKTEKYGIQGQGRHTNMFFSDDYVLIPIKKIETYKWSGTVYCVTVEAEEHSFSLTNCTTANCLKDLLYEDKLREAQYIIADNHITPKTVWKIGNEHYTPTESDLEVYRDMLKAATGDYSFNIVTHHAVNVDFYGAYGKILPLVPEFNFIEDRILTALYTNKALTHGEGSIYANAQVAMSVLAARYSAKVDKLLRWLRQKIFLPVAMANDFFKTSTADVAHGVRTRRSPWEREYVIPDINWIGKVDLIDDQARKEFFVRLRDKGSMSLKKVCEVLGEDYEEVVEELNNEIGTVADPLELERRRKEIGKPVSKEKGEVLDQEPSKKLKQEPEKELKQEPEEIPKEEESTTQGPKKKLKQKPEKALKQTHTNKYADLVRWMSNKVTVQANKDVPLIALSDERNWTNILKKAGVDEEAIKCMLNLERKVITQKVPAAAVIANPKYITWLVLFAKRKAEGDLEEFVAKPNGFDKGVIKNYMIQIGSTLKDLPIKEFLPKFREQLFFIYSDMYLNMLKNNGVKEVQEWLVSKQATKGINKTYKIDTIINSKLYSVDSRYTPIFPKGKK